ncbi:MAG: hypothetical protein INH41_07570 [Myxococcaceae bacterium]|nr:hypothetical protein [Myxococcaceae bacterium]MCA3012243.1 hypothetical protein [Myxococcaceae bacterium]
MNATPRRATTSSLAPRRRLSSRRLARWLVALALVAGTGVIVVANAREASGNPLARHALTEPLLLEGRVTERLRAGPYLYLRLERPEADPVWVATVARLASMEDEVSVTAVARAETFPSARLGRSFSPLLFGAVRAASSTHTQEKP